MTRLIRRPSVAVMAVIVMTIRRRGGAAHHVHHRQSARREEPRDQYGGDDQEGDVEPGGVVPRDRRLHHRGVALLWNETRCAEEQFDEVLEELWALAEHGEIAEVGRMEVHGALPVSIAIEKMIELGLVRKISLPFGVALFAVAKK